MTPMPPRSRAEVRKRQEAEALHRHHAGTASEAGSSSTASWFTGTTVSRVKSVTRFMTPMDGVRLRSRGCLETYASASGICRTVSAYWRFTRTERAARYPVQDPNLEDDYRSCAAPGPIALQAFELTADILGVKLADSVAHTSPRPSSCSAGSPRPASCYSRAQTPTEHHLLNIFKNKVNLLPPAAEGNTAVLGAAALICTRSTRNILKSRYYRFFRTPDLALPPLAVAALSAASS